MSNIVISLKDVWKIYQVGTKEVYALCGLTLDIQQGKFVCIQGPSGSGKSTAMNMVGCLDRPSRGVIRLDGKDISKMSESRLAQIRGQKIGFIFQSFNLIPTLTAMENITLPMMFQGISQSDRKKRAQELLDMVELGDRINHKPTELSGGQQQRVAIARALVNDPEVILADEPTGNLDSKTGLIVMDFLKKLHKEKKKTIVLVTHDPSLTKFADRTVYILDGKITEKQKKVI
jgi:putative ABC transport system ATP-binding protein